MSLSPAFLDEVRARTHLSGLIGAAVKLVKAGREMKGCCPFHDEKSPSFYVNDDKGFYHCFGCSAHGDAIRWMVDHQGLPFVDAVKELCARAGLEMPAPDPRAQQREDERKPLFAAVEAAAAFYARHVDARACAAYLEKRGITPETAAAFRLGFAPDGGGALRDNLGPAPDVLIAAGLLLDPKDGRAPIDRFRARLMIPINDPRGRPISFGGRILGAGDLKYMNGPDTTLFDKGRTLFNLDRAAAPARRADRIIVVEGYLDVIGLHQIGIGEAVAPLGTALTEAQMSLLWRVTGAPILLFDGDAAGQKAAIRAAVRALPGIGPGRSLRFATLPAGQDPDDLARAGGREAIEAVLANTRPLVDVIWESELAAEPVSTPEARAGLRQRLLDHVAAITDASVAAEYRAEFGRRFDGMFRRAPDRAAGGNRPARGAPVQRGARGDDAVVAGLLADLIETPGALADVAEDVHRLPVAADPLRALRDAMADLAFAEPDAMPAAMIEALRHRAGDDVVDRALRRGRVTFTRGVAPGDRVAHLRGVVYGMLG